MVIDVCGTGTTDNIFVLLCEIQVFPFSHTRKMSSLSKSDWIALVRVSQSKICLFG